MDVYYFSPATYTTFTCTDLDVDPGDLFGQRCDRADLVSFRYLLVRLQFLNSILNNMLLLVVNWFRTDFDIQLHRGAYSDHRMELVICVVLRASIHEVTLSVTIPTCE